LGTDLVRLLDVAIYSLLLVIVTFTMHLAASSVWIFGALMLIWIVIFNIAMLGILPATAALRLQSRAQELLCELSPCLPETDRLLIIRSPADEASGLLGIFQFLSQVTVRLFFFMRTFEAHQARLTKISYQFALRQWKIYLATAGASLLVFSYCSYSLFILGPQTSIKWPLMLTWFLSFVSLMFFFGQLFGGIQFFYTTSGQNMFARASTSMSALLIWLLGLVLSLLMWLPFGWQVALANVFLDVTSDATPIGAWERGCPA
jgi:hypothetical protein